MLSVIEHVPTALGQLGLSARKDVLLQTLLLIRPRSILLASALFGCVMGGVGLINMIVKSLRIILSAAKCVGLAQ